ncbi:hypothetical protein BVRB_5g105920 [Beta vulgaris subsp. vulgaris]|nr:hypothetical protein BVRB_5g105920 [Beta vulgaris subsp. vulgaris]
MNATNAKLWVLARQIHHVRLNLKQLCFRTFAVVQLACAPPYLPLSQKFTKLVSTSFHFVSASFNLSPPLTSSDASHFDFKESIAVISPEVAEQKYRRRSC